MYYPNYQTPPSCSTRIELSLTNPSVYLLIYLLLNAFRCMEVQLHQLAELILPFLSPSSTPSSCNKLHLIEVSHFDIFFLHICC